MTDSKPYSDLPQGFIPPPPFVVDQFRFTGFSSRKNRTPLFPTPTSEELVVSYFSGGSRTAEYLEGRFHKASVLKDFINRAAVHTLLSGHKPYAVQLILHGGWTKNDERSLAVELSRLLRKKRLAMIHPFIQDFSCDHRNISALIWAEKKGGAPVFECQPGDLLIAASQKTPTDPDKKVPFPDWDSRIMKIWTEKYKTRQKTVRCAAYVRDFSQRGVAATIRRYAPGLQLEYAKEFAANEVNSPGLLLVCTPVSANAVMRRLVYLSRRTQPTVMGMLTENAPS